MTEGPSVLVIGAGHNGLVCAAYLGRAGYPVVVLEARETVGGAASNRPVGNGFTVSGLAHLLHSLNSGVCADLDLGGAGFDPGSTVDTIALDLDGRHLTLGREAVAGVGLSAEDARAYGAFKREFQAYARALDPLRMNKPPRLKGMDFRDRTTLAQIAWNLRVKLGRAGMQEFLRVGGINIHDVLNERFGDERLQGAIAADAVIGHHMGPRTPNTVLTYLNRLQFDSLQSLPPGGMGQVTAALEQAARRVGVTVRTGQRVRRVLVDAGKAIGVQLESGEQVAADIVVSSADARTTFLKLVGPLHLDAMFVKRVDASRARGDVAKLHFALGGLPAVRGLSADQLGQRLLVAPDMRYVEHAFNHAKYGEYSQNPVLEIVIPSIADPSLAPDGHHVMSVVACFAPYRLKGGWASQREAFAQRVIDLIERYAPGFASLIVDREVLTPVDMEQEYGLPGGHWHHGELALDQSFMMRPVIGAAQYDTPIEGLFLCGAAAHPGGGVTGLPGRNAARRILAMRGKP